MKKFVFLIAAITMMSCSQQEMKESVPSATADLKTKPSTRSYDDALRIAKDAIGMLENSKSTTRSNNKCRKIDLSESKVIMRDSKTRGESGDSDSLIYVFNFENDEGFALVSASKNTEGLLAITELGHCDPTKPSGIKGFDMFVDMAKDYIAYSSKQNLRDPSDTLINMNVVDSLVHLTVGPHLSVRWGDIKPEGEYFNNGIAGCTNVAMAQIMSYFNYPTQINLTYNSSGILNLNWSSMKTHHTFSHSVSYCGNATIHSMISSLVRQIGYLNNSDDSSPDETSTNTESYAASTFSTLGYSTSSWYNYSKSDIQNQLNVNHLLLIKGHVSSDIGSQGHTWVVDGYRLEGTISYVYKQYGSGPWILDEIIDNTIHYNHFNWGKYGSYNGYFSNNVFDMQLYEELDTGTRYSSNNFKYRVKLLNVYR